MMKQHMMDPILMYYMILAITEWRLDKIPVRPEFCK